MDRRGYIRLPHLCEKKAQVQPSLQHPTKLSNGKAGSDLATPTLPSLGPDVPGMSYLSAFQLSFSMWFSGPSLSKEAMKRAEEWRTPESHHPHRWVITSYPLQGHSEGQEKRTRNSNRALTVS